MSIGYQPVTMSPGSSVDDQFLNLLQAALMRAPSWSDGFNYSVNDFVTRSGKLYCALQISGPSTAAIDPSTDPGTYWQLYASGGSGSGAKNFVKAPLLTGINNVIPVGVTHSGATSVAWDTSDTTILASGALKCVFPASGSNRYVDIAFNALNAEDVGITWWVGAGYRQSTLTDGLVSMVLYDGTTETPIAMGALPAQGGTLQLLGATGIPTTVLATQCLRIKIVDATAVTFWLADLSVGPRIMAGGAGIGNWNTTTLPIIGTVSNPTKGTITQDQLLWRRVGSNIECYYRLKQTTAGTAGSGVYYLTLSSLGITANDSIMLGQSAVGEFVLSNNADELSASTAIGVVEYEAGTSRILFKLVSPTSATMLLDYWSSLAFAFSSTNIIATAHFTIPISQWTSNINLASDFTEYASNSSSTDANDTSSFVSGSGGAVGIFGVTALTATRLKRIQFSRPIQTTDKISIEILRSGQWVDVTLVDSNVPVLPYTYTSTAEYGIGILPTSGISTYVDVVFGRYCWYASTFGGIGGAWNAGNFTSAGARWRVRKISNGNMAEVPPIVRASYTINSAQTPINSVVIIQANQKDEDTHNAVTTGAAWKFTAPIAGLYQIDFGFTASVGHAVNAYINFQLYKGGNPNRFVASTFLTTSYARGCDAGGSTSFRLNAGEYIDLRWVGSTAGITANIAGGTLTITRLGN